MEKLSISQASKQFGISRARLYQLLEKGTIMGYRSMQRGRGAGSWISTDSLLEHINVRDTKIGMGRPKVRSENNNYVAVMDACKKSGYSETHVYRLVNQGLIISRKGQTGILVFLPDLLNYKNKK